MRLKSCRWLSICISPHLESIVRALAKRIDDFSFLFLSEDQGAMRRNVGWTSKTSYQTRKFDGDVEDLVATDLFIDNVRHLDVLEQRVKLGKVSVYMGERWFKPPVGFLRLFSPSYNKMAKRFVNVFKSGSLLLFPCGIHAVRDMLRMCAFFNKDYWNFFYTPRVAFESRPGGRIYDLRKAYQIGIISKEEYRTGKKVGFVQIRQEMWSVKRDSNAFKNLFLGGYIVESKEQSSRTSLRLNSIQDGSLERPFRILWAGRMLDWKRIDVLIKSVKRLFSHGCHVSLLIVGEGPEYQKLLKCAGKFKHIMKHDVYQKLNNGMDDCLGDVFANQKITFSPYLKNSILQRMMRDEIDLYVMSSDGGEGWGAVVNEAILSKCPILSTFEAGSSATLLSMDLLFHAKSIRLCTKKLEKTRFVVNDSDSFFWTGEHYVTALLNVLQEYKNENFNKD